MRVRNTVLAATMAACLLMPFLVLQGRAAQPLLGFSGKLVSLPRSFPSRNGIRGMRVCAVNRGSYAARMGLERGDVIVTLDHTAFTSRAGYNAALRMCSQRPSLLVINVRTGRLTRVSGNFPHTRDTRKHPDTMGLAIDLTEDMRRH